MEVFTANKRFWKFDNEGWQYWIESEIISYHSTIEGANAKISSFPDRDKEVTDDGGDLVPIYFVSSIVVED